MNSLQEMSYCAAFSSMAASLPVDMQMEIYSSSLFLMIKFVIPFTSLLINCILSDIIYMYSVINIEYRI